MEEMMAERMAEAGTEEARAEATRRGATREEVAEGDGGGPVGVRAEAGRAGLIWV